MAIDTSLATCAGHQPSERQWFRKQRTVNPLIVPARYNFLYSYSRPACGRPPPAAALGRQSTTWRVDHTKSSLGTSYGRPHLNAEANLIPAAAAAS
jgi:hypothetical protein